MAQTYGKANDGQDNKQDAEETDDIASRFPDVEKDQRLKTPRGRDLPEPPQVTFTPPTLPQSRILREDGIGVGGLRGGGGAGIGRDDLRGTGLASAAGISLVVAILACTGIGWAIDKYALHSTGTPWGLIIGFMIGVASGFMNLFRLTAQINRGEGGNGSQ